MMRTSLSVCCTLAIGLIAPTTVNAAVPSFEDDVLPILQTHCASCHGADVQKNGLDVRTREGLFSGGKSGEAIRPGSLRESLLWTFIATDKMPANDNKLSDDQKDVIRRWIVAGAPDAKQAKATQEKVERSLTKTANETSPRWHRRSTATSMRNSTLPEELPQPWRPMRHSSAVCTSI